MAERSETRTGGRAATTANIDGDYALAVGTGSRTPPEGWQWQLLTSLARLETGHTPSRKHPEYWDGDIPWIGIRDATGNHGRTIDDTEQHVTQAGIDNSSARLLPQNTVCLSRTASVGYVVVMGRPMATSQDFVNWVCDPEVLDYRFLKYVLLAEKRAYDRFSHGTTHQTIYFPEVKALHICAPDRDGQTDIADVLSALDDKIEQNRRTARTLERLARAIFTAWFVDFEPVKAKVAGATSFPSMPQPIFDALPTAFTTTDHGPVPEGWEMGSLGDVIEIHDARRVPLSKRQREERRGPYRYYGAAGVVDHVDGYLFDGCFTLVGEDGTVYGDGDRPMTQYVWGQFWVNNHAHVLTGLSPWTAEHIYVLLHHVYIRPFVTGAVQPKLNQGNLKSVPVVLPPDPVTIAFGEQIDPLFQMLRHIEDESIKLATMRDYLLPQLLSGRVTVEATDD